MPEIPPASRGGLSPGHNILCSPAGHRLSTRCPPLIHRPRARVAGNSACRGGVTALGLSLRKAGEMRPARLARTPGPLIFQPQERSMKLHLALAPLLLCALAPLANAQLPAQPGETGQPRAWFGGVLQRPLRPWLLPHRAQAVGRSPFSQRLRCPSRSTP